MVIRNILPLFLFLFFPFMGVAQNKAVDWKAQVDSLLSPESYPEEMLLKLQNLPNIEVGKGISFEPKNRLYRMTMHPGAGKASPLAFRWVYFLY